MEGKVVQAININRHKVGFALAPILTEGIVKVEYDLTPKTKPSGKCEGIMLPEYYECLVEIEKVVKEYIEFLKRDYERVQLALKAMFDADEKVANIQYVNDSIH